MEDSAENLIIKFPKKEKDIYNFVGGKERVKSKIKYLEFWGGLGEWVCWKYQNTILGKKKNPNFDYDNDENNLFERPQFPYLLLSVFAFGDETGLYDETSLIEQTSPLQEGINQLEQQIIDLNEGQKRVWVAAGEGMSDKRFQELVDKTGDLGVRVDGKLPPGGVGDVVAQVQSGKPDASLYNNLAHLLGEIDNTIGMHSTTRGERAQQETLGGRQLLMGSDYGRLDLIVRNIEQVMEEWYNAYLHCLKVYSLETETLYGEKETLELRREEIPKGIIVMIKKGSTLPVDRLTKFKNAIQLAQFDKIDPKTLFEEMGYSDAEKRTADLYDWLAKTGKIQPQAQMPAVGQPGAPGAVSEGGQEQQLVRLQSILQSPQFQQLPPEEQQGFLQKGRQIVEQIKGGVS